VDASPRPANGNSPVANGMLGELAHDHEMWNEQEQSKGGSAMNLKQVGRMVQAVCGGVFGVCVRPCV